MFLLFHSFFLVFQRFLSLESIERPTDFLPVVTGAEPIDSSDGEFVSVASLEDLSERDAAMEIDGQAGKDGGTVSTVWEHTPPRKLTFTLPFKQTLNVTISI